MKIYNLRVSFTFYNSEDTLDFLEAVKKLVEDLLRGLLSTSLK